VSGPRTRATPRGFLFDFGGTLVEEVAFDTRAGLELLLARTVSPPSATNAAKIFERAERVTREVGDRRDRFQIETPWISLTRLIHDYFGTRFTAPLAELELAFWDASIVTRPMPGARDTLLELRRTGIPMGVISNSSFGQATIRHELAKHGLSEVLDIIVVSAEYAVRKPNPLLFEAAAGLLGVPCADVWFVGDRLDTDIAGARAAGMTAVWYAPSKADQGGDADIIVSAWSDLAMIVRDATA
jgi:putative hydrolase of the HAD superfamily